jgi:hypothetical protein
LTVPLLISGIGQYELMFGTSKQRREAWRLDKHLPKSANLFAGIE